MANTETLAGKWHVMNCADETEAVRDSFTEAVEAAVRLHDRTGTDAYIHGLSGGSVACVQHDDHEGKSVLRVYNPAHEMQLAEDLEHIRKHRLIRVA